jgi:uncharacterized protein (TIGR02145 family)
MRISIFILSLFLILNSCIKNINPPSVTTSPITEITWEYAISGGEVIDDGGSPITARGICATEFEYDPPALDSDFEVWYTSDSSGMGNFISKIPVRWHGAALSIRCTTYIRAYATNKAGTTYGELLSFYPKSKPPGENGIRLGSITSLITSASIVYSTEPIPRYVIEEVGICYSTFSNPSFEGDHIVASRTLAGDWASVIIGNLTPDTKYYIRGYIKNESGISYSNEISFTTLPDIPSPDAIKLESVTVGTKSITVKYSTEPNPDYSIAETGICYGTAGSPTYEEDHIIVSLTNGETNSVIIDNLTPNVYYVRGYVKNELAISYSNEISLEIIEGSVTDIDGNIYEYKTIGSQIWMKSDLKTTKNNDGTTIPEIQDNIEWSSTNNGAYCTYTIYGKLYNYYAIANSQKLCPTDWHVPSDEEWKTLEMYLGMSQDQADTTGIRGSNEGGKLKNSSWLYPNTGANNSSGFSATGSGYRLNTGTFLSSSESAYYWTVSEFDVNTAWCRALYYNNAQIGRRNLEKKYGFSVRCIKD